MASELKFDLRFGICGLNCMCNHVCLGCLGLLWKFQRRLKKKEIDIYYYNETIVAPLKSFFHISAKVNCAPRLHLSLYIFFSFSLSLSCSPGLSAPSAACPSSPKPHVAPPARLRFRRPRRHCHRPWPPLPASLTTATRTTIQGRGSPRPSHNANRDVLYTENNRTEVNFLYVNSTIFVHIVNFLSHRIFSFTLKIFVHIENFLSQCKLSYFAAYFFLPASTNQSAHFFKLKIFIHNCNFLSQWQISFTLAFFFHIVIFLSTL